MTRISRRDVGDAATGFSLSAVAITLSVLFVCGLAALLWWLGVFTSGIKGAGDVTRDQNDAKNREHWSATFNSEFQQIQADQGVIANLEHTATSAGATVQDHDNLTGAQNNCRQDVAQYNADASSTLGAPWLPEGLPTQINADNYCGS
ncbi:hypothetical protein AB0N17_03285 [Streptomyces sp. NPDC051133]|uniref:hypothetical protein n=1 Tax=Streptomyces sp. NPDC051133 TaxID=3155521 RepID=UPI003428CB19